MAAPAPGPRVRLGRAEAPPLRTRERHEHRALGGVDTRDRAEVEAVNEDDDLFAALEFPFRVALVVAVGYFAIRFFVR